MEKCLFPLDAYMVSCPTWSKNLGRTLVYTHRRYVLWMRGNKRLTKFLQKNRFIYPFIISFLITAVTFPNFLGQFIASKLNTHDQVHFHNIFFKFQCSLWNPKYCLRDKTCNFKFIWPKSCLIKFRYCEKAIEFEKTLPHFFEKTS